MSDQRDEMSEKAAAELQRLAEATAMLRLFHAVHGRSARTPVELSTWIVTQPQPIRPTEDDYATVRRSRPDLVQLANRSNPYLSGSN